MQDYRSSYPVNPYHYPRRPARIARVTYLVRWILLACVFFVTGGFMDAASHASTVMAVILMSLAVGVLLCGVVALFRSVIIPRVRDVGLHPAWSLLVLLHSIGGLFVLALLFIPTDAFARPTRSAYY